MSASGIRLLALTMPLSLMGVSSASAQAAADAYTYDAFGRVIAASHTAGGQSRNSNYTYDDADNRDHVSTTIAAGSPPTPGGGSGPQTNNASNPVLARKLAACAASTPSSMSSDCRP